MPKDKQLSGPRNRRPDALGRDRPCPTPPRAAATAGGFHITDEQRHFWAFQPVKVAPPPAVKDTAWPRSDLDRYILAALEAKGLKPAKPADKRTLLRRATFDLTGLPPTPEEMDAFLKDEAPDAFAKVVDRLLASPAYGERWGRHWLDLARYTDSFDSRILTTGSEMDCGDAWRYRDWVIDAFNRDLPYDQFVRDQIAGDLVPGKDGFNRQGIIATGFLAIGNWGGGDADKDKLLTDIADDQVDVTSRTFLGLTVACARCHDHKFDPIAQADYYGLAGIFFSTHILPNVGPKTNGPPMLRIPLTPPAELAQLDGAAATPRRPGKAVEDDARPGVPGLCEVAIIRDGEVPDGRVGIPASGRRTPCPPVAEFAAARGLHAFALRQWLDYLGGGDYKLLTKPIRDVGGKAGVSALARRGGLPERDRQRQRPGSRRVHVQAAAEVGRRASGAEQRRRRRLAQPGQGDGADHGRRDRRRPAVAATASPGPSTSAGPAAAANWRPATSPTAAPRSSTRARARRPWRRWKSSRATASICWCCPRRIISATRRSWT